MNTSAIVAIVVIIGITVIILAAILSGVLAEWLKTKRGYPIEGPGAAALIPASEKSDEQVRLLTNENERLRDQLAAVHDRLETLERIVTDKPSRLEKEIDALRSITQVEKARDESNIR